jgi:hypothetical protein
VAVAFSTRRLIVSNTAPRSIAKVSARCPAKTRMPVSASVKIACAAVWSYIGVVRGPMFDGAVGRSAPPNSGVTESQSFGPFRLKLQPRYSVTR